MPYVLLKEPVFIAGELKDAEEHIEVSKGLAANLVFRGKAELLAEYNADQEATEEPEPEKKKPAKGKRGKS
ncbi:hypothetical protein [Endozoicomonas euniceicola]|uniref:Uncharacterized protein n=1 Tax=Endozoicomonas euniceicola TaxID=1234143 RepID=A0ABY6GNF0_9GAMM|nr:hypothetical protein [Endozoicomonas euniceicola]UYM14264.1 hypothetical protein NX720_15305 [Endozoicomonas euniceicola]